MSIQWVGPRKPRSDSLLLQRTVPADILEPKTNSLRHNHEMFLYSFNAVSIFQECNYCKNQRRRLYFDLFGTLPRGFHHGGRGGTKNSTSWRSMKQWFLGHQCRNIYQAVFTIMLFSKSNICADILCLLILLKMSSSVVMPGIFSDGTLFYLHDFYFSFIFFVLFKFCIRLNFTWAI